jgi:hypothetical protein
LRGGRDDVLLPAALILNQAAFPRPSLTSQPLQASNIGFGTGFSPPE